MIVINSNTGFTEIILTREEIAEQEQAMEQDHLVELGYYADEDADACDECGGSFQVAVNWSGYREINGQRVCGICEPVVEQREFEELQRRYNQIPQAIGEAF